MFRVLTRYFDLDSVHDKVRTSSTAWNSGIADINECASYGWVGRRNGPSCYCPKSKRFYCDLVVYVVLGIESKENSDHCATLPARWIIRRLELRRAHFRGRRNATDWWYSRDLFCINTRSIPAFLLSLQSWTNVFWSSCLECSPDWDINRPFTQRGMKMATFKKKTFPSYWELSETSIKDCFSYQVDNYRIHYLVPESEPIKMDISRKVSTSGRTTKWQLK